MTDKIIPVGRFAAPHGVKGWIRVISYCKPSEQILEYSPWKIKVKDKWHEFSWQKHAVWSKKLVVLPKEATNRNDVESLVNVEIGVTRESLGEADNGYFWCDLIGLNVKTVKGHTLGKISSLMETGANDVIIINGQKEHLVPFREPEIVKSIDLEKKEMLVDWELDEE